jgi:hypothetical protein
MDLIMYHAMRKLIQVTSKQILTKFNGSEHLILGIEFKLVVFKNYVCQSYN